MILGTVYLHLLVSLAAVITGVSTVPVIFHKNSVLGPLGLVSHDSILGPLGFISNQHGIVHVVVPHHVTLRTHPTIISGHGIVGPHGLVRHHGLIGPHLIVHKDHTFLHPVKPVHHFVVHHGPHLIAHKHHHLIKHHPVVLVPHKFIHHGVLPHKHKFIHHAVHPHIIVHHGGTHAPFLRVADPEEVREEPQSEVGKFISDMLKLGGIDMFGEETSETPVDYDEIINEITDADDNKQKDPEPQKESEKSEECSATTSKEIADKQEATTIRSSEVSKKGGEFSSHLPVHESPHQSAEVGKSPEVKQLEVAPEPSTNVIETAAPSTQHSEQLPVEKKRPKHPSDQHVHTSGMSLLPGLQHAGAGVNVYHNIDLGNKKHLTGYKVHEYDHENEDFGFEPNRFCMQVPMPYHRRHHDRGYDTNKFGVEGGGSKDLGKIMGLGGNLGIL